MKNFGRRGFFASLAKTGGAAAVLASLPEPAKAEAIQLSKDRAYVLSYAGQLPTEAYEHIKQSWTSALGPDAPRLIILEEGMTLQELGPPRTLFKFARPPLGQLKQGGNNAI